jgi:glycosyltransferase involved in cell wall biosynthesis
MFLVIIHVPIYVKGGERLLTTDWKRSLLLLRDSFDGCFGRVQVVSPSLDVLRATPDQPLEALGPADDIDLFPSFPYDTRARAFWREHVHTWRRDIAARLPHADVVHTGFCDVYRPLDFIGFLMALRADKASVFVQDTDQVLQVQELMLGAPLPERIKQQAYCQLYERSVRFGVARASLSLLKGRALQIRYGRYAKNLKNFHDTAYLTREVVPQKRVEARVADLLRGERPLRLVYCGRLEARKGVHESIDALHQARSQGARATLDIIGDGVERAALERRARELGITDAVRFLGMRAYGPQLLADLADYDALFFTPSAEDTPRMIFDGYAAGLPLLGYGIEYVRERELEDGAARSVQLRTPSAAAALLCALDRDRSELVGLTQRAHQAALFHAADAWYERRAQWTREAVATHRASRTQRVRS